MENPVLMLDSDFDDDAWLWESKGFYSDALVSVGGKEYALTFYDKVRLAQDVDEELKAGTYFYEKNLVVIPSITRANMEVAVLDLATHGAFGRLTPNE